MNTPTNEGRSTIDILDWRLWRHVVTEDRSSGDAGAYMNEYGHKDFPWAEGLLQHQFAAASYTHSTRTVAVGSSELTHYQWASGDMLHVTDATDATKIGLYTINKKVDADSLVLSGSGIGADQASVDGRIVQIKRDIYVGGKRMIAMRLFGYDNVNPDDKTAHIRISGWMEPLGDAGGARGSKRGVGPGFILLSGLATCGKMALNSQAPIEGTSLSDSLTWKEFDTYDFSINRCQATMIGEADAHMMVVFLTHGFSRLLLEVKDIGDSTEVDQLGVIWRPALPDPTLA